MNIESRCPYCQGLLDEIPTRKKMCPHCQNFMFIRSGKLVTDKEASEIDERWSIMNKLKRFNILEKDYENSKIALIKRWGFAPKPFDIIWDLLNEKTEELAKAKRFDTLSFLYYQMASFLNEEGKDFFYILQQSRKTELENMQAMGIKKVEIMSGPGCCSSCEELNRKKFTIEEALNKMPIPNKNCTNRNNNNFCRCLYESIIKRG